MKLLKSDTVIMRQISRIFYKSHKLPTVMAVSIALMFVSFFSPYAQSETNDGLPPIPEVKGFVNDYAGLLSASQKRSLENSLRALEKEKGAQLVLLIVPTTGNYAIEQFGIETAEKWKIGRKGVDDGVIFIVAVNDHRMRIEVGYGLEGAIPDALAKQIITTVVTPHFRSGDMYGGINAGVEALSSLIRGEPLPEVKEVSPQSSISFKSFPVIFIALFIISMILRAIFGRLISVPITGLLGFIAGFFLVGFTGAIFFALLLMVFSGSSGRGGRFHHGGFYGGGFGGGGGFSSGGFGGFSGGGGSFGGGGASGSW